MRFNFVLDGKVLIKYENGKITKYEEASNTHLGSLINDKNDVGRYILSRVSTRSDAIKMYAFDLGMTEDEVRKKINSMNSQNFEFALKLVKGKSATDPVEIVLF